MYNILLTKEYTYSLEDLLKYFNKFPSKSIQTLLEKLSSLQDKIKFKEAFDIEETIHDEIEVNFAIEECLLLLTGIISRNNLDFILAVIERECLKKVINFFKEDPLRIYHSVMHTDWAFREACEIAIKNNDVDKVRLLAITLKLHFENLNYLYNIVKKEEIFGKIFKNNKEVK